MKKIKILLIVFLCYNTYPQSLWQISKPSNELINAIKDTSISHLKSILLNQNSNSYEYSAAANYLAYYYKDSEKQWLLDNLQTTIPSDSLSIEYLINVDKFFSDQIIKGYLGDHSAISGLQTIINLMNYKVDKIIADRYLSEAGIYNNFNLIKNAFLDSNYRVYSLQGLRTYANNPQYRSEVISLLSEAIINSTNAKELSNYTYDLFWIDSDLTVDLLDQKFREFSGWDRQSLFIDLYKFDPNNQPRRSMWAIPLEPDENLRAYYIPFYPSIESGIYPKVYLQPYWINFLKNWYQTEGSANIKDDIVWFVHDFKPLIINVDSNITTIDQIIYLKEQVDSVYDYTWLGDLNFSNELKNILTTAKTNLQNGDSLACRVQIKAFQDLVDNVYKDSLNTDVRFVTIEGWKFLYWNAQYILDRLPETPIVVPADIEVINPAMSLVNPGSFTMEIKGTGFTTSSIVYFNGNARTTTFISDSILSAQILSTNVSAAGNFPVWVSSGTTNSDTLYYSVVSSLPKPVRPVLECVRNNGDGTYTAFFGYKNENSVSVYIPVGSKNKFTPTPQDRGQTTVFQPGRKYRVFTVNFNGSNLVWTLNGRTSTASSNSAPCN